MSETRIGTLSLKSNVFLAPMAGVTDIHFREAVISFGGCGLSFTELLSVEGMVRRQRRTLDMLQPAPGERPFAVQLYGSRPEAMASAAQLAVAAGAELIDINAGCPARKILKNQAGAFLMKDPPLLERILREVRAAIPVPLTLKFRSGFQPDSLNYLEIGRLAEACGADAVTLHPRTRVQMFSGRAEWEHIGRLKAALRIPVVGNGDIWAPADAAAMLQQTGCDAVMVGRGITRNPWLIRQVDEYLRTGACDPVPLADKIQLCLRLCERVAARLPSPRASGELKKFCSWWIQGFSGAAQHRQRLYAMKEPAAIVDYLRDLSNNPGILA